MQNLLAESNYCPSRDLDIIDYWDLLAFRKFYDLRPENRPRDCLSTLHLGDRWKLSVAELIDRVSVGAVPAYLLKIDGQLECINSKISAQYSRRKHEPENIWYQIPTFWISKAPEISFYEKQCPDIFGADLPLVSEWLTDKELRSRWGIGRIKLEELVIDGDIIAYFLDSCGEGIKPSHETAIRHPGMIRNLLFSRAEIGSFEKSNSRLLKLSSRKLDKHACIDQTISWMLREPNLRQSVVLERLAKIPAGKGCGRTTLRRWLKEAGLPLVRTPGRPRKPKAASSRKPAI
jgi:hypothetical protein